MSVCSEKMDVYSPSPLRALVSGRYSNKHPLPPLCTRIIKNAFNSHSRQAAFDTLAGVAAKDYVGAGVLSGDDLPHLYS